MNLSSHPPHRLRLHNPFQRLAFSLQPSPRLLRLVSLALLTAVLGSPGPAQTLIDVDFGAGASSPKTGFAATGVATNDFWNHYHHYEPRFLPGMPLVPDGRLDGLKLADGSPSRAAIALTNAPGVWGNSTGDPMLDSYVFAPNGSNILVTLSGLDPGRYHFYLYGYAAADATAEQNSAFTLRSGTNTFGPAAAAAAPAWSAGQPWRDRAQFVVFRDVPVVAGEPVTVIVAPGPGGVAVLNGLQILSRGTGPPRLTAPEPPPLSNGATNLLFREVRYSGQITPAAASFSVALEAESRTTNELTAVIFEGDLALLSPKLPDGWRVVSEGKQFILHAAAPGSFHLEFQLAAKVQRAEPWNQISLAGPPAAIALVEARTADADTETQLLSGTPVEEGAAKGTVRGVIGADRLLSLRWQSKMAEVTREAVVQVDSAISARLTPAAVRYTSKFQYQVLQSRLGRVKISLPDGQTLTQLQGDGLRDWRVEPVEGHQVLTVEFLRPVTDAATVTLTTEQALGTLPTLAEVRLAAPLGVQRENGSLQVSTEDLLARVESSGGLRQIDALPDELAAWQFNTRPVALQLRLSRIEPLLSSTDRVRARLEETRLVVRHELAVNATRAAIYSLELMPPPGFVVADLQSEGLDDWRFAEGKLRVGFNHPVLGVHNISVQLEQALTNTPPLLTLLPLRVTGATNETAFVGAGSAPGLQLKTGPLEAAREISVNALPGRTDELLAFRADQPEWRVSLSAERLAPRVVAEVFDLVTIGDGLVGGGVTIRFGIVNQGVQQFRVRLPKHWRNVEFTGPNIRRKDQQDEVWTIALQDKAWGAYTLVVTYDYPFDQKKAEVDAAGAHPLDVERETGSLAVTSAANLSMQPAAIADPLRKIDPTELSATDRSLISRAVLLACRYEGTNFALGLNLTRHEEVAGLDAIADRAQLTTVLTESGEMLTEAGFMVKNNERQFQRFLLPKNARLWGVTVNGEPAKADQDGDWLLVSLPREANRDAAFAVDLKYAQEIGAVGKLLPKPVELVAPKTDVPGSYAEWKLYVPRSTRPSGFDGNMTVARGTTYGFRDGWKEFLAVYAGVWHNYGAAIVFGGGFLAFVVLLIVNGRRRGFGGMVAVIALFGILGILAGMMLPALAKAKGRALRINSVSNLQQIGVGARLFAGEHEGRLASSFDEMLGEIASDRVLLDPETGERYTWVGAGKSDSDPNAIAAYSSEKHGGREVLLADGSVQQVTAAQFSDLVRKDAAAMPAKPGVGDVSGLGMPGVVGRPTQTFGTDTLSPQEMKQLESKPGGATDAYKRRYQAEARLRELGTAAPIEDIEHTWMARPNQPAAGGKPATPPVSGGGFDAPIVSVTGGGVRKSGRVASVDGFAAAASLGRDYSNNTMVGGDANKVLSYDSESHTPALMLDSRQAVGGAGGGGGGGGMSYGTVSGTVFGNGVSSSVNAPAPGQPPAAPPTATGIKSLRIEIPRSGREIAFTRVLNLSGEPPIIRLSLMSANVFLVVRTLLQVLAFLAGLALFCVQWRRAEPKTLSMAVGAALALVAVTNLFVGWRMLGLVFILAFPTLLLLGLLWMLYKLFQRPARPGAPLSPSLPPLPPAPAGAGAAAAIALLCLLACRSASAAGPGDLNTVSIVSAVYTGETGEKTARIEAVFEFLATGTNQSVTLFGQETAVEEFKAVAGGVRIWRDGENVGVLLPDRGPATARLKILLKLGGDNARRQLSLALPPALGSRLSLSLDEPDADIEFPDAIAFTRVARGAKTEVEAVLGASDRAVLSWTPRSKRASDIAATVFARQVALVTLGAGVVNTRSVLEWQISQGELRDFRVAIPSGQRVLKVTGAGIRSWETDGTNGETLLVHLLKPVSPSARVTLETERSLGQLPEEVRLLLPRVLEVKRETGSVAVRGGEELSLLVRRAAGLEREDNQEFVRDFGGENGPLLSAWRFLSPGIDLAVRAEAVKPKLEAVLINRFSVGQEQISLLTRVDYTVSRAGLFSLRLALPAGLRAEEVLCPAMTSWNERDADGTRVLEIALKQRTLGAVNVQLRLLRSLTNLPPTLELAGVHPLETDKLTAYVSVAAEPGVGLKTASSGGLSENPSASMPDATSAGPATLAFKYLLTEPKTAAPWKLTVAAEPMESWVRAEVASFVTISETLVSGRAQARYEIMNSPVKEFKLRVPAAWRNVEIFGAGIRRRDQRTNAAGVEWRVELQSKVQGEYKLAVRWEQQRDGTNTFLFQGLEALGAERETGALAVFAQGQIQVTPGAASDQLLRIDARELPDWAADRPAGAPALSYRYLRPGWSLGITARRFEDAALLEALVDNLRLRTVVADDGQFMTQLGLSVRNNGRQSVAVTLPPGAAVWAAFVDGQPVRPSREGDRLLLPLERTGADDAPIPVELTYVGSDKFPRTAGEVEMVSPRLDVPLKDARWEVYLPPDYVYSAFKGSMAYESADLVPIVQDFTLAEYQRQESSTQEGLEAEAVQFIEKAREDMSNNGYGSLNKVIQFQNRVNQRLGNETAVQELDQLSKDLNRAQGSNLIRAQRDYAANSALDIGGVAGPVPIDQAGRGTANDDALVAGRQAAQLQKAQAVGLTRVTPLRVNLPTRGVRYSFTQALQTGVEKPLTVRFHAANDRDSGWLRTALQWVGGFLALWLLVTFASILRPARPAGE